MSLNTGDCGLRFYLQNAFEVEIDSFRHGSEIQDVVLPRRCSIFNIASDKSRLCRLLDLEHFSKLPITNLDSHVLEAAFGGGLARFKPACDFPLLFIFW